MKFACPAVITLAVFICGCQTLSPRMRLEIGNASDGIVSSVVVEAGTVKYSFGSIAPHSVSRSQGWSPSNLLEAAKLTWQETNGTRFSTAIVFSNAIPRDFAGQIQLQIDGNHDVMLFGLPSKKGGESDLPWNAPAHWEGTPMLPGLSR